MTYLGIMTGLLFGAPIGYLLCIAQAKVTTAIYRRTPDGLREESDRRHREWVAQHPQPQPQPQPQTYTDPPTVPVDLRSLRERFNLPGMSDQQRDGLIRTPRCPTGYGAAQILGYDNFGRVVPSFYPGGKEKYLLEN